MEREMDMPRDTEIRITSTDALGKFLRKIPSLRDAPGDSGAAGHHAAESQTVRGAPGRDRDQALHEREIRGCGWTCVWSAQYTTYSANRDCLVVQSGQDDLFRVSESHGLQRMRR